MIFYSLKANENQNRSAKNRREKKRERDTMCIATDTMFIAATCGRPQGTRKTCVYSGLTNYYESVVGILSRYNLLTGQVTAVGGVAT